MTELLIRSIARRPVSFLARPWSVLAFALALAYGGGLWLVLVHKAEGGTERDEPGLLLHVLRDSTLALPAICLAVWVATILARRIIERCGAEQSRVLSAAVLAAAVGVAASVVAALGNPLHASLFTAHHGGHELPFILHAARDGAIALAVNLPIAAVVSVLLLKAKPWAAPQVGRWLVQPSRTRAAAVRLAVIAVAVIPTVLLTQSGVQMATAQQTVGACPSGAPVKSYDVEAIDVDIPLNRFGDHDPDGKMFVLSDQVDAVRAQEARIGEQDVVSVGLGDDAIQPLIVRANIGDCVEFNFTNNAAGEFGMQVDGLAFDARSSGAAVGNNPSSTAVQGESRTYRYYVPDDPAMEGDHYIRPGPGNRSAVNHGLFGSLTVEPKGSTYHHPETGEPIESGWEAVIKPGEGEAFREYVKLYHEIGNEDAPIQGADGELPMVDPHTTSYRPGSRAINYRSEPFIHRLDQNDQQKSLAYNSYTFGDPATPMQRAYVGDPSKIRITHAGSEMNHVYHLHGGGIRWRLSPEEDTTYDYQDTQLQKHPETEDSPSNRLDSQSFGPGESFNLEIEGGAGGVQHAVGDLLEHCHIAEHYLSGMWAFWRVFDTRQPDLLPLNEIQPSHDQPTPPDPVTSDGLIGKTMPDGSRITKNNLDDWVEPQLPPQGVPNDGHDASVWNWSVDRSVPNAPKYLGEPENPGPWPNLRTPDELSADLRGHPTALAGDEFVGDRRALYFNPETGRPAYPLLRPNLGARSPHAPNGHSGAPYLGEDGDQQASGQVQANPQDEAVDPWAAREDGICPNDVTETRQFDLSAIELPIKVTDGPNGTDQTGRIFALNEEKEEIRNGSRPTEPLTLRSNVGDCADVSMVSELNDDTDSGNFSKTNLHIHHVQFDPQGSDGASAGMVFDQSVRPYAEVDPQLTRSVSAGETVLPLDDVSKFVHDGTEDEGVFIGVGLGEPKGEGGLEIRQVESVDTTASTVTIDEPLEQAHAAGQYAGTEFVQSRWYPDVQLDNVFFHDHVDGIANWGKGMVGQFIVEPRGSTYHDPETGEEVRSGAIADIHTQNPLAEGLVESSFREFALMTIGDNPVTDSTINLKAEPWAERLAQDRDPSLLFSSYRHGDPFTPLPRAYAGDPFVIRTLNVTGNGTDTLHIDGHRSYLEPRYSNPEGTSNDGRPIDAVHYGVSERFTLALEGGAGGPRKRAGDYLYANGKGSRFEQGAWGMLRVLGNQVPDLQPLPGNSPGGGANAPTGQTGGRPPVQGTGTGNPGNPCPGGAPEREFDVAAVDLPPAPDPGDPADPAEGREAAFVTQEDAAAVKAGDLPPEPLTLHAAAGECVTVNMANERVTQRASFHVDKLDRTTASSGVNIGFNPEQTVAPGESRTYRYYVDNPKLGTAMITDFGDQSSYTKGLYGSLIVAPAGAKFQDPETGEPRDTGTQVVVRVPGQPDYRDFTVTMATLEDRLGANTTPYTVDAVNGMVNYESEPRPEGPGAFSSRLNGDPTTPILRAHAGDPVRVHAMVPPGNNMEHVFSLGGLSWAQDPYFGHANQVSAQQLSAWETVDAHVTAGAGTPSLAGDVFYGDNRRAFSEAGMWGLMRVLPSADCDIQRLSGTPCPDAGGPAPPTATPEGGAYNPDPDPGLEVALAADDANAPGAKIYYTTDGTEPTNDSPVYTAPIQVTESTTVKAIAEDEAGRLSDVATFDYEIDRESPARPSIQPGGGFVYRPVNVELSAEQGSDIFYTTDGSTPTEQSERYTAPMKLETKTVIKAIAVDATGNTSEVAERSYEVAARVRSLRPSSTITLAKARNKGIRSTFEVPVGAGHYEARLMRVQGGRAKRVATRSGAPKVSPNFQTAAFNRSTERGQMARGQYRVEVRIARTAAAPLGPVAVEQVTVR